MLNFIPDKGHNGIGKAPIFHLSGAFYVVGGSTGNPALVVQSTIGRFDLSTRKWTQAGDLVTARTGHNVIYDGNYLLVIGGYGNKMSEKCSIENEKVKCTSQMPQLNKYEYYPELQLVPIGYCRELP